MNPMSLVFRDCLLRHFDSLRAMKKCHARLLDSVRYTLIDTLLQFVCMLKAQLFQARKIPDPFLFGCWLHATSRYQKEILP